MRRLISILVAIVLTGCAHSQPSTATDWRVIPSEGIDALLLIGAAGGDIMQADIYGDEIAWVEANVSAEGLAAIRQLDATLRGGMGRLTGPVLCYFFSAGSLDSLDALIESANDPDGKLKPGLMTSPHWNEAEYAGALGMMPVIRAALTALRDAGFRDWYVEEHLPSIRSGAAAIDAAVSPFDVIPEQARLLGRPLEPRIDILVTSFARPYGIRILGQRFVAWYGWEGDSQLRIAAHEIFHPPYDPFDKELFELLTPLEQDPWMQSIVKNHDPKFGYNSFHAIINEDSTQALDQIVSERLGFAEDPRERWRTSDGGMHMLAAAIYDAMIEDGFAEQGGVYADWLKSALRRGLLTPERVRERATRVVDAETANKWDEVNAEN